MQNKLKKMMILALLGLMLASASTPTLFHSQQRRDAAGAVQYAVLPNAYFQSILSTISSSTPANTTFFAPFDYNASNFTVFGKFLSFRFYSSAESGSVGLYNVNVNQSPLANVSRTLYNEFLIPYAGSLLGEGAVGSIFYAYSNSTLLIAHNDPQALIQVYTYQSNVTVQAVLSNGLQPNSKFTIQSQTDQSAILNGTVAMMFNDTELAGFFVSDGSDFSEQQVASGSFYVTKTIPAGSYLNTFSVPNGNSPYASALSTIAQAMGRNTISYFAAVTLSGGQASADAAYFNNALRVEQLSVAKGDVRLQTSSMQHGLPNIIVLMISDSVFNSSKSGLVVEVNGKAVVNVSSLPSIVNPFGNSTKMNTTETGAYTIVTVYSPSEINSLQIYVRAPQPANVLLTVVAPFTGALVLVTVASILLFRRKRLGGD